MTTKHHITVQVNGQTHERDVEPRRLLCDMLRTDLHLRGVRVGCEHGVCGSCTVLLDGEPIRSCTTLAVQVDDGDVETVESLAGEDGGLHPLQESFSACHALQCGYCTPGFLMTLKPAYDSGLKPDRAQIRGLISGNLCRCTGYQQIVEAVERAFRLRDGVEPAGDLGAQA
jgi:carbon-monoxide dehydrogenase small subunit/6-hydroxypseudooxynicotine dehydrogenase subunit beta